VGRQIEELARFVATTRWDDVPAEVQHHTKLVVLDTLGVILAGAERPEVRQLRMQLGTGSGATVFCPGWPTHDARTAALLNGIAGRSVELCEGLRFVSGQAAMQVLPGVLAVGESARRSGREMLTALLVGYDVVARLAGGFTARSLAHQNGQVSLVAAAAAGACLRGLDAAGISRSMRIATTLVLTPSYTNAVAGATALNIAGGMSGFVAALAPELALAGFEAEEDAVELAFSQLVGDGFQPDQLTDELGSTWHIMRNPDPPNFFASKYSLPHAAATMAVRGRINHASLDDGALDDPEIAALRHRVTVTEDPAMSAVAPQLRPARVTVMLTDGRRETQACESHRGDFQDPFTESELRDKFGELAGGALTSEGIRLVEQAVDNCEKWDDVGALTALFRKYGRQTSATSDVL
jgi:2-methylcitrate dehydratase PrpD